MTRAIPVNDDDVEAGCRGLRERHSLLAQLEKDTTLSELVRAFKKSRKYHLDVESLEAEIQDMLDASARLYRTASDFDEGSSARRDAAIARSELRGHRSRYVALIKALTLYLYDVEKVHAIGKAYLLDLPAFGSLTVKQSESLANIALGPIHEAMANSKRLLSFIQTAVSDLDDGNEYIDKWFLQYKEYTYAQGYAQRPFREPVDEEGPHQAANRLTRRSREAAEDARRLQHDDDG